MKHTGNKDMRRYLQLNELVHTHAKFNECGNYRWRNGIKAMILRKRSVGYELYA